MGGEREARKEQGKDRCHQRKPWKSGRYISYISRKHFLLAFVSALYFNGSVLLICFVQRAVNVDSIPVYSPSKFCGL